MWELVDQMVGSFQGVGYGELHYRLMDKEKCAALRNYIWQL